MFLFFKFKVDYLNNYWVYALGFNKVIKYYYYFLVIDLDRKAAITLLQFIQVFFHQKLQGFNQQNLNLLIMRFIIRFHFLLAHHKILANYYYYYHH